MTVAVYQCSDAVGRLLYVGVSKAWPKRLYAHEGASSWWGQVASVTVEHCPSRAEALAREAELIRDRAPSHNSQHRRAPKVTPLTYIVEAAGSYWSAHGVGRVLKLERVEAGVTLTAVAAAVGVSIGHLSHIEAGRRTASPELITRIRSAVRAAS